MASSDEESGDSAVTLDIVRQVGEDEGTVELAKKDLTSIFNKINQSLSDLSALDLLSAGDCDDVTTKSGIILKEKIMYLWHRAIIIQTRQDLFISD